VGPSELNQLPRGPFGIVLHRSGLIGALVGHPPRIRPAGCPVRCRFGALTQPVIMGGAQSSRGAAGYLAAAATALRYTAASPWERSGCRSFAGPIQGCGSVLDLSPHLRRARLGLRAGCLTPTSGGRRPRRQSAMFPNEIIRDANVWRPVSHSTDLVVSGFAARAGVITARPPRLRATSAPIILDTFGNGKFCPLLKRHETVHGQGNHASPRDLQPNEIPQYLDITRIRNYVRNPYWGNQSQAWNQSWGEWNDPWG
jgi:hypothetical protein